MKNEKSTKKLKLSKTTLRKLSEGSLRDVAGGGPLDDVLLLIETPGCTNAKTCDNCVNYESGPGKGQASICC